MIGDLLFLTIFGGAMCALGAGAWRVLTGSWPKGDTWAGAALVLGLGLAGTIVGVSAAMGSFEVGLGVVVSLSAGSAYVLGLEPRWNLSNDSENCQRQAPLSSKTLQLVRSFAPWAIPVSLLVLVAPGLVTPVTDGDALCYHLEVAKRTVKDGRIIFDPDLHETAYPLVVEALQAVALKLRGPVATRAVSFWFGVGFVYATVIVAGRLIAGPGRYLAGLLIVISPIVHCGMIAPLNDVALAALGAASLAAWIVTSEAGLGLARRAAVAGLFCGLGCGVKFPGIVWCAVMAMYVAWELLRLNEPKRWLPDRRTAANWAAFMVVAIVAGGFWYARSAILTGNPVHPYFRNTFGGNGLDEVLEDARKSPVEHVVNILYAPVGLAFEPGRFDSFSHQVGPLFLALIPLGALRRQERWWWICVALGWLTMALCLTQRQSPRFFIVALAPWAAASARVIVDLAGGLTSFGRERRLHRRITGLTIIAGLVGHAMLLCLFDAARIRVGVRILAGAESPREWLSKDEPTARLAGWVDSHLPENARLVGQDHRGFYWPRPFTMEKAHRRRTGLLNNGAEGPEVIDRLRNAGFTHLVMAEPDPVDAVEFDIDLSVALGPHLSAFVPMLDTTITEREGYVRRYRIFALERLAESGTDPITERSLTDAPRDSAVLPAAIANQP